jgi:hypothetical protein
LYRAALSEQECPRQHPMKKVGAGSHFIMILELADIRQKNGG